MLVNVDAVCVETWDDVLSELDEQRSVLELHVGEEQLGRSLLGYVTSGLPRTYMTNGGDALFLFGPDNAFRIACWRLVNHSAFETFVQLLILLSSLTLVVDNPRTDEGDVISAILEYSNLAFAIVFAIEMTLKVIAFGLVGSPGAYLRSGWNWLDAFIVFVSVLTLFISNKVAALRAFRTLRALRPLRAINRNRGLKMIFFTLLQSIKGIAHVALLSLLNYLIFGILAGQFLGGKLYECNDPTVVTQAACIGNFTLGGTDLERRWATEDRNYDNIFHSLLTLFQVSTGDDWSLVMYAAMDATDVGTVPVRDAHPEMGLFFVAFYIIGNFFMLNLFVGVVIFNFNNVKDKLDGLSLLTQEQKNWVEAQHMMLNFRPETHMTPGPWRVSRFCHKIVEDLKFEIFIAVAILCNVIVIATEHSGQGQSWEDAQLWLNAVFALVFFMEAAAKIIAHGSLYFKVGWNRFDCLLAIIGVAGTCISLASVENGYANGSTVSLLRVLRIVRILRVLRLFKQARQVRILVETLWFSLPSIGNISLFMLMIYFVFAVVGMQMFANVPVGRFIDDEFFNYRSFPSALQLMFIFTTNERWSDAMYDCMNPDPLCEVACGDTVTSALYHVLFVMISAFVISNLFIAIILDNFSTTMRMDQSHLNMAVLLRYTEIWGMHDAEGTMLIPTSSLPKLLAELQPPLGIARCDSRVELLQRMAQYQIPEHNGSVHFIEVLIPLASAASGVVLDDREVRRQQEHVRRTFPELRDLGTVRYDQVPVHVGHYLAQTYVASVFRGKKLRRQLVAQNDAKLQKLVSHLAQFPDSPEAYHHRLRQLLARQHANKSMAMFVEDF
jgi:hypothetical protein